MKKITLLLGLTLLLSSFSLAAGPPLTKEEIKASVAANLMYVTSRSGISLEITDTGNYFKEYRDGQQYLGYANLVYIYWTGSYGQKIREAVEVDFLNVNGRWVFAKIFKIKDGAVQVEEPTMPLPAVPEAPTLDLVQRLTEGALPRANDLMEQFVNNNKVYKISQFNVGEAKFEWRGLDYTYAAYVYTGDIVYTLSDVRDKKHKEDQEWTCQCQITVLYDLAKQNWECKVNTSNSKRIK